jgi:hypothetical protein
MTQPETVSSQFVPKFRADVFGTVIHAPKTVCHVGPWLASVKREVYRLLFESIAELIRRTDTPRRLATDSGE